MRLEDIEARVEDLVHRETSCEELIHRLTEKIADSDMVTLVGQAAEIDRLAFKMDGLSNMGILFGILVGIEAVTGGDLRCGSCSVRIVSGTHCHACGRIAENKARAVRRAHLSHEADGMPFYA